MGTGVPHYVQWGFISVTVPNLVVLGLMIVVFALALALRLPEEQREDQPGKAGGS
jgi:hypothetical protein